MQTSRHQGFFYTVPSEHFNRWLDKGLKKHFYQSAKSFDEACIMIRSPAQEVINCLKATDYESPVLRYVFYGRNGCGKSTSLANVIHYCGMQGWIIVHSPWAAHYNRYADEILYSTYRPGRVDQPEAAVEWLTRFRKMNDDLLQKFSIVTENEYSWSKREVFGVGTPLTTLIELGLDRVKYASDVMGVILKELRLQTSSGKFKMLVAIDGVNAFWSKNTNIQQEEDRRLKHSPSQLTIVHNWKKMISNDWKNGAIVCTVDGNADYPSNMNRCFPLDLLGKEGFEHLDPFVPINVTDYNSKECYNCIDYYIDRKWLLDPRLETDEGRNQLISLSCNNPLELYKLGILL